MRSSRVMVVFAAFCAASLISVSCSTGGDVVVASDLGLGRAIEDSSVENRVADPAIDGSALRSGNENNNSSRSGADDAETSDRPTPPTLSESGAASLVTSTTFRPPAAPSSVATTSSPTTVVTSEAPTSVTPTTVSSNPSTTVAGSSTNVTAVTTTSTGGVGIAGLDQGEGHSFTLLNQLRSGLSLQILSADTEMAAFARDWSRRMATTGNFQHSSGPYGENIAFTSNTGLSATAAADLFHQLWLDSPGHYRNMTNESYTEIGVGLYLTERGWYGTHVFKF